MKTLRWIGVSAAIVAAFMITFAGLTNLDSLYLGGYLKATDSVVSLGTARIAGAVTQTGAATFSSGVTISGKTTVDSFLVLGATKYWNGGLYVTVQNKSGATLRVGAPVKWDGTYITLMTTVASTDTNGAAGLTALAAEGTGYYSMFIADAGTNPNGDTLFLVGTDQNTTVQYDTLITTASADTCWSTKIWKTVTTATFRGITGQNVWKVAPLLGVTFAAGAADADSTVAPSGCGVVYPSTIADNAWGTILVEGVGKILFTGLDGLANVGSPLDMDADSTALASVAVKNGFPYESRVIGYSLQTVDGGGSLATAGAYGIRAIWAYVKFR